MRPISFQYCRKPSQQLHITSPLLAQNFLKFWQSLSKLVPQTAQPLNHNKDTDASKPDFSMHSSKLHSKLLIVLFPRLNQFPGTLLMACTFSHFMQMTKTWCGSRNDPGVDQATMKAEEIFFLSARSPSLWVIRCTAITSCYSRSKQRILIEILEIGEEDLQDLRQSRPPPSLSIALPPMRFQGSARETTKLWFIKPVSHHYNGGNCTSTATQGQQMRYIWCKDFLWKQCCRSRVCHILCGLP